MNHLGKCLTCRRNSKPKLSKFTNLQAWSGSIQKILIDLSYTPAFMHWLPINSQPTNQTPHPVGAVHQSSVWMDTILSINQNKNVIIDAYKPHFTALNLMMRLKYLRPVNTRWLHNEHPHHVWPSSLDLEEHSGPAVVCCIKIRPTHWVALSRWNQKSHPWMERLQDPGNPHHPAEFAPHLDVMWE